MGHDGLARLSPARPTLLAVIGGGPRNDLDRAIIISTMNSRNATGGVLTLCWFLCMLYFSTTCRIAITRDYGYFFCPQDAYCNGKFIVVFEILIFLDMRQVHGTLCIRAPQSRGPGKVLPCACWLKWLNRDLPKYFVAFRTEVVRQRFSTHVPLLSYTGSSDALYLCADLCIGR